MSHTKPPYLIQLIVKLYQVLRAGHWELMLEDGDYQGDTEVLCTFGGKTGQDSSLITSKKTYKKSHVTWKGASCISVPRRAIRDWAKSLVTRSPLDGQVLSLAFVRTLVKSTTTTSVRTLLDKAVELIFSRQQVLVFIYFNSEQPNVLQWQQKIIKLTFKQNYFFAKNCGQSCWQLIQVNITSRKIIIY